jgi:hypothetical protein
MWKEEVVAYFETLYRCSPRGAEEIHRVPQSEYPVPATKLESHVSKMQLRIITTGTNLLDRNIIFPYRVILLNNIQFITVTYSYKYCGGI